MQSKRFLLVEGVRDENGRGHPVTDPHNLNANPSRFAGWTWQPVMKADGQGCDDVDGLIDHYQPTKQVIVDHGDLRAAIKLGHLKLHAECVEKTHDNAAAKLNKVKPTKGGEK